MKRFFYVFVGIFIILFSQHNALGANGNKIAVVDVQKLQKNSAAFRSTRAVLKKKFDALQQKLDQEKKALLRLEEDFRKQSMMLSLDAKEDKRIELEKKRRYYQYIYEDYTQEMKNAEIDATRKIGKDLEKIVERIAQKEGYALIIERRTVGLLYYDDAIDITDQVTEAYDKMKQ